MGGEITSRAFYHVQSLVDDPSAEYKPIPATKFYRCYAYIDGTMKRKHLACFCNDFFNGKDCDHVKVCGQLEVFQTQKYQTANEVEEETPPNVCEVFDADYIKSLNDED